MRFAPIVEFAGPLGLYALGRQLTRRHPRILMYHRFSEQPTPRSVSAAVFERQVEHLARKYHPMTLGELAGRLRNGHAVPPHAIVVTVDDGHHDFHDVAWPILERHGVPATLFVTTGFIDGEAWLWPDQVRWLLNRTVSRPKTLDVAGTTVTDTSTDTLWHRLIDLMLTLTEAGKQAAIRDLAHQLGASIPAVPPREFSSVSWAQLRQMQTEGLEVGGHTHTHPSLTRVPREQLSVELDHCLRRLTDELGERPRPFCYPNGQPADVDPEIRDAVEAAGFTCSVVAYADGGPHDDPFQLRRHSGADDYAHFRKVVSGVEWFGAYLRQRTAS